MPLTSRFVHEDRCVYRQQDLTFMKRAVSARLPADLLLVQTPDTRTGEGDAILQTIVEMSLGNL